jgi:branched-chain amino acid transport system ATP-binding protein
MTAACLEVAGLECFYGATQVLRGVGLAVPESGVVALLGRNGAGKTTTLRALMNLTPPRRGTVRFLGSSLAGLAPHEIARLGMTLVPEHRGMFPSLTVLESLELAAGRRPGPWTVARVVASFPRLAERRRHRSAQLSGGEQQLLAIARALLLNPRLLLLDEPTEGLAPIVVRQLQDDLLAVKAAGTAMLLVEQNLDFAAHLADSAVVLGRGAVQWTGAMADLRHDEAVTRAWLGL